MNPTFPTLEITNRTQQNVKDTTTTTVNMLTLELRNGDGDDGPLVTLKSWRKSESTLLSVCTSKFPKFVTGPQPTCQLANRGFQAARRPI